MILSDEDLAGAPVMRAKGRGVAAEYAAIEAVNWSTLRHLDVSPKLLRWRVDHPRPDTPALRLGRAIHCAILEPEAFAQRYIVEPDFGDMRSNTAKAARAEWLSSLTGRPWRPYFDARTKAGKLARAEWLATLSPDDDPLIGDEDAAAVLGAGVEVIGADEHELAQRCAEAVREHPIASRLLIGGRAEEVITWTDPETGLACKAKLDFITPFYVLDLKSTRHEKLIAMEYESRRLLYYGQLAFYHDGAVESRRVPGDKLPMILYVQTTEPYDIVVGRLMQADYESGRALYRKFLRQYAECSAADYWPGIAPGVIDLDLRAPAVETPDEEDDFV